MRRNGFVAMCVLAMVSGCGAAPEEGADPAEIVDVGEAAEAVTAVSISGVVRYKPSTGNLYWISNGDEFDPSTSRVYRKGKSSPASAGAVIYSEANQNQSFRGLTYALVNGVWRGFLLAQYGSTVRIKRFNLDGSGGVSVLATSPASAGGGGFLETDGANLFWGDSGGLRRMSVNGGAIATLTAHVPVHLGLDDSRVYYTVGAKVFGVLKAGGGQTTYYEEPGAQILSLHVHDPSSGTSRLYWSDQVSAVRSMSATAGASVTTHQGSQPGRDAQSVWGDGSRVYWSDCTDTGSDCKVRGFVSGFTVIVDSGFGGGARQLHYDGSDIYLVNNETIARAD